VPATEIAEWVLSGGLLVGIGYTADDRARLRERSLDEVTHEHPRWRLMHSADAS
jgi:hypothetical protein